MIFLDKSLATIASGKYFWVWWEFPIPPDKLSQAKLTILYVYCSAKLQLEDRYIFGHASNHSALERYVLGSEQFCL